MLFITIKETLVYLITFLFIYNISLCLFINMVILSSSFNKNKTLASFRKTTNLVKKYIIVFILLSIAGVPPFIGFFLKINLMSITFFNSTNMFFIFFLFFFAILYFYIQNIRLLLIPDSKCNYIKILGEKKPEIKSLKLVIIMVFTLTLGFNFLDDFLILSYWFLS